MACTTRRFHDVVQFIIKPIQLLSYHWVVVVLVVVVVVVVVAVGDVVELPQTPDPQ